MSRLSIDPFQHNRRLSETNLLDLKCQANNDTCPTRSESHSVAQSPPPHLEKITLLPKDYKEPDNPFQNDALPLWEKNKKMSPKANEKATPFNSHSNISSPDNNNYGGQQQAYRYRSLNETPTSPELAKHRMYQGSASSPPPSPEIIQVKGRNKGLLFLLFSTHYSKSQIFVQKFKLTNPQHFHEFFIQIFFDSFSREIKVVNS